VSPSLQVRSTANVSNLLTSLKALLIAGLFCAGAWYAATVSTNTLRGNLGSWGGGGDDDGSAPGSSNGGDGEDGGDHGSYGSGGVDRSSGSGFGGGEGTANGPPASASAAAAAAWGGELGRAVASLGRAVVPCLWAFDGWADVGALAEDLRDPQTTLPRIILASVSRYQGGGGGGVSLARSS